MKCPCCGGETDRPTLESLRYLKLPLLQRKALDALLDAHPRQLSGEQLADRIYSDRIDGGPIGARRAVNVYLHHIRRTMADTGWWVGRKGRGNIGLHFIGQEMVKARLTHGGRP